MKIQRNFLQEWGHEGWNISWVKWKNLYIHKKEGGLGIKYVEKINIALIPKWK